VGELCVWAEGQGLSEARLVAATQTGLFSEEQQANAQLIAAAPDLLAAAELALRYMENPDVQALQFALPAAAAADRLRAAVEAATGPTL
jgi:hypothetical protein